MCTTGRRRCQWLFASDRTCAKLPATWADASADWNRRAAAAGTEWCAPNEVSIAELVPNRSRSLAPILLSGPAVACREGRYYPVLSCHASLLVDCRHADCRLEPLPRASDERGSFRRGRALDDKAHIATLPSVTAPRLTRKARTASTAGEPMRLEPSVSVER